MSSHIEHIASVARNLTHADMYSFAQSTLQRRFDTKFVVPIEQVAPIVEALRPCYGVLLSAKQALASYSTIYFDNNQYDFFRQHHRGVRNRYKVRVRHYLDRKKSALEIKEKTNRNITVKQRFTVPFLTEQPNKKAQAFLRNALRENTGELYPSLETQYNRITLVSMSDPERVTIDLQLSLALDNQSYEFPKAAIVEIKQPRIWRRSSAMCVLRTNAFRPVRISKYCLGIALLMPWLRHGRFKPMIRNMSGYLNEGVSE